MLTASFLVVEVVRILQNERFLSSLLFLVIHVFCNGFLKLHLVIFINVVTSPSSIQKELNVPENVNTKVYAKMDNAYVVQVSKENFAKNLLKLFQLDFLSGHFYFCFFYSY